MLEVWDMYFCGSNYTWFYLIAVTVVRMKLVLLASFLRAPLDKLSSFS